MTFKADQTLRVLLDRLNWPVHFVRWRAAEEYASLLSTSVQALATEVYLEWLKGRKLESEVVSGLSILLATESRSLPPPSEVKASIRKSSILADFLFQRVYREVLSGWAAANSGAAPTFYQPEDYFTKHNGQAVPSLLLHHFDYLEREYGFPFNQQWAYEWSKVMEQTSSSYSSFPYHFIEFSASRSGITGQFSQAQCHVYRSAYLRTLSFAVQEWGMPRELALISAVKCLPLNWGLRELRPIRRPEWLSNIPEKCCRPDAALEKLARTIVKTDIATKGMRPVSLCIPINSAIAEYGELSIEACYASGDFAPNENSYESFEQMMSWGLTNLLSFQGHLSKQDPDQYRSPGAIGSIIPVCVNILPIPLGFWLNEYAHLGIALPAPYNFSSPVEVGCKQGAIKLLSEKRVMGQWQVWHDDWSALRPSEGHTRCGGLTEMNSGRLVAAAASLGMALSWYVELKLWERPSEYGQLALKKKAVFFRD